MAKITGKEHMQRIVASRRAGELRRKVRIEASLDAIKHYVAELEDLNYPSVRYPRSTSKSIVFRVSPGNDGDEDEEINRKLDVLEIDLQTRVEELRDLRRRKQ